jgi:hypothetical protein
MPNVVTDIMLSRALVYYAPTGTAVVADTVAAGTAWGGAWVTVGFTSEPLTMNYETEEKESRPQQSLGPVRRWKTSEDLKLETVLEEFYLDGVQLGTEGVVSDTAAGSGVPGKETLNVGGPNTLTERAWGFEGQYVDEDGATFPVRVFVWKGTAKLGDALEFDKEKVVGTPLQVQALADLTQASGSQLFRIVKILEPAT